MLSAVDGSFQNTSGNPNQQLGNFSNSDAKQKIAKLRFYCYEIMLFPPIIFMTMEMASASFAVAGLLWLVGNGVSENACLSITCRSWKN